MSKKGILERIKEIPSQFTSATGLPAWAFIPIFSIMLLIIVVGMFLLLRFVFNVKFPWETLATLGSGGSSPGIPGAVLYDARDYDSQIRNTAHGTGTGTFDVDPHERLGETDLEDVTPNVIIDEQNAKSYRKLQIPLVPSTDPAGGTQRLLDNPALMPTVSDPVPMHPVLTSRESQNIERKEDLLSEDVISNLNKYRSKYKNYQKDRAHVNKHYMDLLTFEAIHNPAAVMGKKSIKMPATRTPYQRAQSIRNGLLDPEIETSNIISDEFQKKYVRNSMY